MDDQELLDFLLEGNEYNKEMLEETEIEDEILENPIDLEYSKRHMRNTEKDTKKLFNLLEEENKKEE